MSYFITGASLLTNYANYVGSGALDVTPDIQGAKIIASIEVTESIGGTPNLTIEVYDPDAPASYYKANAKPMVARETVTYNEPFWLPNGWELRITLSVGGIASVNVNYFNPIAAVQR